jgi:hypothetical protein
MAKSTLPLALRADIQQDLIPRVVHGDIEFISALELYRTWRGVHGSQIVQRQEPVWDDDSIFSHNFLV